MDTEIGRLLQSLGTELTNTHVIFVGDNGTPGRVTDAPFVRTHAKGTPYEGGVNVPMIAAGPAVGFGGRDESSLVEIGDLFATVSQLCGAPVSVPWRQIDSRSLVPLLTAPSQPAARTIAYSEGFSSTPDTNGFACARNDRYKVIRTYTRTGSSDEFYDLTNDIFEGSDLLSGSLTTTQTAQYQALSTYILAVRDASGSFSVYGTNACQGSNGLPVISSPDTPQVGSSYRVSLGSAASSSAVWLHVGASDVDWGSIALPYNLSLLGAGTGCQLYASGEFMLSTQADAAGNASLQVAIPNLSQLVGATIYHAWTILDPNAPNNPLGVVTSQGASARLSN